MSSANLNFGEAAFENRSAILKLIGNHRFPMPPSGVRRLDAFESDCASCGV